MKQCKTLLSIVMAIMMLLTMMIPTLAADPTYTIVINNAAATETYTAYKVFDVTYSGDNYAYTISNTNKFYNTIVNYKYDYDSSKAGAETVFTLTPSSTDDTVMIVTYDKSISTNTDLAADLAKTLATALDSMADKPAGTTGTYDSTSKKCTITVSEAGYYFVQTSLGALCFLGTTNPTATIDEKNEEPTIEKKVKDGQKADGSDNWVDSNDKKIGDTVEFKTTVHAKKGAKNYVVHDQMDAGLTLNPSSFKVTVNGTEVIASGNYTITTSGLTDGCDFEIAFTQAYLDTITADTDIVITYSAVLNENAEISTETNDNKTKLDYGDNSSTEWDKTETKTYMVDIIKIDGDKKILSGAKFELYASAAGTDKINLVKEVDSTYRVATPDEVAVSGFTSAVIEAGKITIKGLDSGDYWLEETEAPAGYNKLSARVKFTIDDANLTTTMTEDVWSEKDGGVAIENKSGTELPSTGGIGTTIFYCVGATLALGAFVLLVTKKRMGRE